METINNKTFNRRSFLKALGLGGATAVAGSVVSCATDDNDNAGEAGTGTMTYRENPKTKQQVSLLGYGMMRLPRVEIPGASEEEQKNAEIDQEMVNKQIDYALAHGVNYFDTAPIYCQGNSERATGIALKRHPRDSYFVATKMSNYKPGKISREASIEMFDHSLAELQVDYIDYMLLHNVGGGDDPMEFFDQRFIENGILDFLLSKREEGVIRNLGFSFHGDIELFDYLLSQHDNYHWDFVQIQLNYFDWKNAAENEEQNANYLYAELEKRHIPVIVMEPLLGGRLANLPDAQASKLLHREPERSVASWAFRYAGTHPGVLTVLSGMTYMEHLKENVATYSPLQPLTDEEMRFLEAVGAELAQYKTIPCTGCEYCMPCHYGIDIPAIFAHYNKCLEHGVTPQENTAPDYARERRAFLVGYDRSVPRLRQADHCIGCGHCQRHCPQKIEIPRELHRIAAYVEKLKQKL